MALYFAKDKEVEKKEERKVKAANQYGKDPSDIVKIKLPYCPKDLIALFLTSTMMLHCV